MTTPTSVPPTPSPSNGRVRTSSPPADDEPERAAPTARGRSRALVALAVVGALVAGVAIGGVLFARSSSDDRDAAAPADAASDVSSSSSTTGGDGDGSGAPAFDTPRVGGSDEGVGSLVTPAETDPSVPRVQQPANEPGYAYSEPENSPTPLPPTLPVEVSVSSLEGLRPGDPVNIRVVPTGGSETFGFRARLCKRDAVIEGLYDFFPEVAPNCISAPLSSGSDAYVEVKAQPPYQLAEGAFRVGLGTDTFTMDDGTQASVSCTKQDPCQLVLQVHVPYGFGYYRYDLSFA